MCSCFRAKIFSRGKRYENTTDNYQRHTGEKVKLLEVIQISGSVAKQVFFNLKNEDWIDITEILTCNCTVTRGK